MNFLPLSSLASAGQAVADHLWQSTIFAAAAGFVTLVLRKDHARIRYSVWLTASLKFLVPFSAFITLGNRLASTRSAYPISGAFFIVVRDASEPFAAPVSAVAHGSNGTSVFLFAAVLVTIWLAGSFYVLYRWWLRWRQVSNTLQTGVPLTEGREIEILRRCRAGNTSRKPIRILLSPQTYEPGIFGVFKTVLLWPEGMSALLNDAQIEAIIAHEVWHVRRGDNLAALLHMLVEAIFWFHPLVWWLGSRLLDERERACDEAVLRSGVESSVYAESILKASRFYIQSPLPCVSGVTGSNLEKRIVRIMTQHPANKFSLSRKLTLVFAGIITVATPLVIGFFDASTVNAQSSDANTASALVLESLSVKPNHSGSQMQSFPVSTPGIVKVTNMTLRELIESAYSINDYQLTGTPAWIDSERFDITAAESQSRQAAVGKLSPPQQQQEQRRILRFVLARKFDLKLDRKMKELPIYSLVIGDSAPTLTGSKMPMAPDGEQLISVRTEEKDGRGEVETDGPVSALATGISAALKSEVIDKTGVTGSYKLAISWSKSANDAAAISNQLQKQLGFKLEPQSGPVETFEILRILPPSAD
jgi:uncharacterized protein (TIGR03435 family)